jgi:hypothetical protein
MNLNWILVCFLAFFGLNSCAKPIISPTIAAPTEEFDTTIQRVKTSFLLDSLQHQPWKYFSSKIDVNYANEEKSINLKANAKATKDSAAFAIVSFLTIPAVLAMASQDSVMYVDKLNRCFKKRNLEDLASLFGISLSLANLEELLLALPIGFNVEASSEETYGDSLWVEQSLKENNKTRNHRYALSKTDHKLLFQSIQVPEDEIKLSITYQDHSIVSGFNFPASFSVTIAIRDQISSLSFTYARTVFNTPQLLELNIPDDYENCP